MEKKNISPIIFGFEFDLLFFSNIFKFLKPI